MPYKDPAARREASRRSRQRHPEYIVQWRATHPGYRSPGESTYRARHPDRLAARSAVSNARRDGSLVPLPCEVCGAGDVQAHHAFGYAASMALAVWWLCRDCHKAMHRAIRDD